MRDRLLRFWRIGLGPIEDYTVEHIGDDLVWRRRWWRIWTADDRPYCRSSTRQYFTWRAGQFFASLALYDEDVIAACEAMRTLNRAAKQLHDRHEIYALKQRFIAELLEIHPCVIHRHVQTLTCDGCVGGVWVSWNGVHRDVCHRCGGTGVYRSHELFLFVFTVLGREYRWHQPAENWPHLTVDGETSPYDGWRDSQKEFVQPGLHYETLVETVAQWCDAQGLKLGLRARPTGWHLRGCLVADVRRARRRFAGWRERRASSRRPITVALPIPTRPVFPSRGAERALADATLPF